MKSYILSMDWFDSNLYGKEIVLWWSPLFSFCFVNGSDPLKKED